MEDVNFIPNNGWKHFVSGSDDIRGALFKLKTIVFLFSGRILYLFSDVYVFRQLPYVLNYAPLVDLSKMLIKHI